MAKPQDGLEEQRGPLIARGVERELRDILGVSRAAAITGPRQAGKSTLARQLQAAGMMRTYFSLDDDCAPRPAPIRTASPCRSHDRR